MPPPPPLSQGRVTVVREGDKFESGYAGFHEPSMGRTDPELWPSSLTARRRPLSGTCRLFIMIGRKLGGFLWRPCQETRSRRGPLFRCPHFPVTPRDMAFSWPRRRPRWTTRRETGRVRPTHDLQDPLGGSWVWEPQMRGVRRSWRFVGEAQVQHVSAAANGQHHPHSRSRMVLTISRTGLRLKIFVLIFFSREGDGTV